MLYQIVWETCYDEDFPEKTGMQEIEANSVEEAVEAFNQKSLAHMVIIDIEKQPKGR